MSRYLQKISLRPFANQDIWTGWELEGRSGEIEGFLQADGLTPEELRSKYGVTEFQRIPGRYLDEADLSVS